MKCGRLGLVAGWCLAVSASAAGADNLYQLPPISIVQYGGYVNDVFTETFPDRQLKVEVDLDRGRGFYNGTDGIIALPIKGLSEDQLDKGASTRLGAPVCHLFMAAAFKLLAGGKPVDKSKLRFAKGLGHEGEEIESACYVCAAHRTSGGGMELYLYGAQKEPVWTSPLENVHGPDSVDFDFLPNGQGTLVITLFGKYRATLPFATVEANRHPEDDAITTRFAGTGGRTAAARAAARRNESPASNPPAATLQLNIQRTGYFGAGESLPKAPRVLWRYPEGANDRLFPGDPVVDKSVVYFGGMGGKVYALDVADGKEKWSRTYGTGRAVASPAIVGGMLYLATTEDVKCVSLESGRLAWSRELPKSAGETPPLVVGDAVFVAGGDGVYAFKRVNGDPLWTEKLLNDRPVNSPVFDPQGLLADGLSMRTRAATSDGTLLFQPIYDQCRVVALDCRTGKRQWSYPTRGWVSSHAVVSGRYVLFGGLDLYLHCVARATGKTVWKSPAGAELDAAPAVANGCVYFTARNARVHCVDLETGGRIWMHRMDPEVEGDSFYCAPLVSDAAVYIGSIKGFLCALDPSTGEYKWGIPLASSCQVSSYGLATDGQRLFVASRLAGFAPQGQAGIFAVGDH